MSQLLETLIKFDQNIFRNVICLKLTEDAFDDLSDDPQHQKLALSISEKYLNKHFSKSEVQFNAIDFIFSLDKWQPSRFSNGEFPVWYASKDPNTSFHETAFHWRRTILDDSGFSNKPFPIYTTRTIFAVQCSTHLIDLRDKAKKFSFLVQKNTDQYDDTQKLGVKLSSEGFPGILTLSARKQFGENIVVFNKNVLNSPEHHDDFLYEMLPDNPSLINIKKLSNNQLIDTVAI